VLDAIAKRPAAREPKSGSTGAAAPRAKKGANKQVILDLVDSQPGITPAEISNLTGMKRTVAASTVSRLKRYGYLQEHEQGGVRLVRAARGEHAGSAGSRFLSLRSLAFPKPGVLAFPKPAGPRAS
jgi:predicted transcriptional regulator of viral defense system